MRPFRLGAAAVLFLCGALLLSGFLLFLSFPAKDAGGSDVCRVVFGQGCDATISDPFSRQGGIPVAGWGVVGLGCVLLLLLLGRTLGGAFRGPAAAAASILLLVGALVSAGLVASLAAGVFPLCPLCLVANLLNLAGVATWLRARRGELAGIGRDVRAGLRYVAGGSPSDPEGARWCVVAFLLVAVAGVAIYQWILIETDRKTDAGRTIDPATLVAEYEAGAVADLRIEPDDPALGSSSASAELVVFSDAFCPHCRSFWFQVGSALGRYGEDLRVVYKHFPLESSCNAGTPATMHPGACAAASALEAARRQDAFWAFHERLGGPGLRGRADPFAFAAAELGLDVEIFLADAGSEHVRSRVGNDVRTGNRLGVTATPAVFLNGRPLTDLRPKALGIVIDHVLRMQGRRTR